MPKSFIATVDGAVFDIPEARIRKEFSDPARVVFHRSPPGTNLLDIHREGKTTRVFARTLADGSKEIWIDRYRVVVSLQEEPHRRLSAFIRSALQISSGCSVKAPMPGLIKDVAVRTGDVVKQGQRLVTLEAMKMENEISAPIDGTVGACRLTPGVNVEKDEVLIHITPTTEH